MKKIILFLDIDGVFSIYQEGQPRSFWFAAAGYTAWPISHAKALIHLIAHDPRIHPVWLSAWYTGAMLWNFFAKTKLFPVGYTLSESQEKYCLKHFPNLYEGRLDSKL